MSYPPGPGPYPAAPPPDDRRRVRLRGRIPLRIGIVALVLGIALVVLGGFVLGEKSLAPVDDFARLPVSQGGGTVTFTGTGNYLAYYEADDITTGARTVPLPSIVLRSPSGRTRELDTLYGGRSRATLQITTHLTYDVGGHRGIAIYQFRIGEPGAYQVAIGQGATSTPGADIAFGRSVGGALVLGVALLLPGVVLLVVGLVLLVIGLFRRRRHKRERAQDSERHPGQPYPGQAYPGQPYPGQPYPGQPSA